MAHDARRKAAGAVTRASVEPIKCAKCGGVVPLADAEHEQCPYCGNRAEIPETYRAAFRARRDDAPVWGAGWTGGSHDDSGALSHFDGKRWSAVPLPAGTPLLMSVSAASRTEAYAVGQHGWALTWNGTAWRPSPTGVKDPLEDVYAAGHGVAFAVGYDGGGYVLRTR